MYARFSIPRKIVAALGLLLAVSACQAGSTSHPVPKVSQIGSDLKCATGDHGFSDALAGWGFCYPSSWRYTERSQGSQSPPGFDLTFDVTDIPCTIPTPPPGGSTQPVCSPGAGLFAFMIISTYQRGNAASLADWVKANLGDTTAPEAISWGNSLEALKLADGRRIALTPHNVVILALHAGSGNLNLEAEMSARLDSWKFSY